MSSRTSTVDWHGSLVEGSGTVELTSSGQGSFEYSLATRASVAATVTSPEELLAAAYASCYAMQLAALLDSAPDKAPHLHVEVVVTQGGPDVDFGIIAIELAVVGHDVPGSEADFIATAREASAKCPVGRALSAVPITVDARVAP
ncbi:hypothetical protein BVC93_02680 [Mycobacterium sp. MS1601]|uniref:OsmC family peroxiredoxin n=1 Tax=Mycobacterium sp. MS1601 TaxID=1936029 RepID=UPI0009795574|nr:OsmC family peroxiredoxin [Mycobacterium sp. MS1601]AQA01518.1 hypothetical protein BVC93_02680 [Mycobacterium sp. MS1601]